jgi:hypothetical protein
MMKQMMECLLTKMNANQERVEAKMKVVQEKTSPNNEKFEVLESTFVSWMDIHKARTEANQEEIIAKVDANQE